MNTIFLHEKDAIKNDAICRSCSCVHTLGFIPNYLAILTLGKTIKLINSTSTDTNCFNQMCKEIQNNWYYPSFPLNNLY